MAEGKMRLVGLQLSDLQACIVAEDAQVTMGCSIKMDDRETLSLKSLYGALLSGAEKESAQFSAISTRVGLVMNRNFLF